MEASRRQGQGELDLLMEDEELIKGNADLGYSW